MSAVLTPITRPSHTLSQLLARGARYYHGTLALDSAYPLGGEAVDFGFTPHLVQFNNQDGYEFEWDYTNKKIKVFRPGPKLIVEEVVTVATHVGQLKHKPFYIIAVDVTATTTTGPFDVVPGGETPETKEVAVNFSTGALTFLAADLVTSVRVTYIPLHRSGPFSAGNLVVDEAIAASASKTALANRAAMIQYVFDHTDGKLDVLEPVGEAPSATHKAVVDITNATPTTDIDFHADDATNVIYVTYIKYAAFNPLSQLGDGDLTLASEIYNFNTNLYSGRAIPGLGTMLVGEQGDAANVKHSWSGPSGTLGAGVPVFDPRKNLWSTNETTAIATLAMPIVFIDDFLDRQDDMVEVGVGESLAALTAIRAFAMKVRS